MSHGESDYWILGNKFLAGYVQWHDSERLKWGLTPGATSDKVQPVAGSINAAKIEEDLTWVWWVVGGVVGAAVVSVAIWLIV